MNLAKRQSGLVCKVKFEKKVVKVPHATTKSKKKFEKLTKQDKRAWREALHSALLRIKSRHMARAFGANKVRGKTARAVERTRAFEEKLIDRFGSRDDSGIELQSGPLFLALGLGAAIVGKIAGTVNNTANSVNEVAEKANGALERIKEATIKVTDKLTEMFTAIKDMAGIIWKFVAAAFSIWLLSTHVKMPLFLNILLSLLASFGAPEIVKILKERFRVRADGEEIEMYSCTSSEAGDESIEMQSGVTETVSTLVSILCTLYIPSRSASTAAGEFMKRVTYFPRAADGVKSFLETSMKLLEDFLNFVLRRGENDRISLLKKDKYLQTWIRKVIATCKEFESKPNMSVNEIQDAHALVMEGHGFYEILHTKEARQELDKWMTSLKVALQPHRGALAAKNNVRAMPYMFMLGGESAIGKTTMVRCLASITLLLAGECTARECLANMWQKGTTEYWNGYVGQKCLVMDDAFQVKGVPGDPDSEAMQIIRAIGNWSYPLNYADVESKGRFYLNTPLVVGTTNCMNIKDEWAPFITKPEALVRRFQGAYWLKTVPEYRDVNGKLDYKKWTAELKRRVVEAKNVDWRQTPYEKLLDMVPWEAWEAYPHNFASSTISDTPIQGGLRAAILAAAEEMKARQQKNESEIEDLQEVLDMIEQNMKLAEAEQEIVNDEVASEASGMSDDYIQMMPVEQQSGDRKKFVIAGEKESSRTVSPPGGAGKAVYDHGTWIPHYRAKNWEDFKRTSEYVTNQACGVVSIGDSGWIYAEAEDDRELRVAYDISDWERRYELDLKEAAKTMLKWIGDISVSLGLSMVTELIWGISGKDYPKLFDEEIPMEVVVPIVSQCLGVSGVIRKFICDTVGGLIEGAWGVIKFILGALGLYRKPTMQSNAGNGVPKKKLEQFDFPTLQVGVPPKEDVHNHIYNNTYNCVCYDENDTYLGEFGQFLGLGSDVFVFPKHFIHEMQGYNSTLKLKFIHSKQPDNVVTMSIGDFLSLKCYKVDGFDIAAVSMGLAGFKSVKNILKYFLTQSELVKVLRNGNTQVRLDVARFDDKIESTKRVIFQSPSLEYVGKTNTEGGLLRGLVRYTASTAKGDCGAPLSIAENRHYGGRCVLGIHVAGRDAGFHREGYATILPRETVTDIFDRLKSWDDAPEPQVGVTITPMSVEEYDESVSAEGQSGSLKKSGLIGGSMYMLGKVSHPIAMAGKTALKKSVMQDHHVFGPSPSRPAILHPIIKDGEFISPMARGLVAYQTPQVVKKIPFFDAIVELATKKHFEATKLNDRSILTFEEAVCPPEHLKLKAINRKSSAGIKHRVQIPDMIKYPGKTWWLGFEGDVNFEVEPMHTLRREVQEIIESAKVGERCLHLFTDFLKDELRPNEKVDDVKTRVISGAPFDYTIAVRMYFGAFLAAMFSSYVDNGMAPGINHYTEWFRLSEALLSKGNKMFDGDFSRFDSSEQPWLHEAILNYINRWYRFGNKFWKPEDDVVRRILWLDLVHSRHVTGVGATLDVVVQWNKSLPIDRKSVV